MRRYVFSVLVVAMFLIGGCDSAGVKEEASSATFEAQLQGPVNTTLKGSARLGETDAAITPDFDVQVFLSWPLRPVGSRPNMIYSILLAAQNGQEMHHLGLHYFGTAAPAPGTYTFEGWSPLRLRERYELPPFLVTYTHSDAQATRHYLFESGTITLTEVSEQRMAGSFELRFDQVMTLTREMLEQLLEALENEEDLLLLIPAFETLSTPLVVTGTFDAGRVSGA